MKKHTSLASFHGALGVLAFISLSQSRGADHPFVPIQHLAIGQSAPDFILPGVDGKTHSLHDYDSAKVLVVVFTCNHCPVAQAYEDRIIALDKEYRPRGVALVAINPNDAKAIRPDELGYTDLSDSLDEMKIRAKDKKFTFPYLYDGEEQNASTAYGALATPHVFIFDADRKLQYAGRIDDSDVRPPKTHEARDAIEALLAGKPVAVQTTKVFGCSTKWIEKRAAAKAAVAKTDAEPVELKEIEAAGVKALVRNDTKKLRLINVWATWCGPCVDEMPDLVQMNRMYRKRPFEMVTITMDWPARKAQALEVLQDAHASTTNYLWAGENNDKLVESLDPQWAGPTPYTLLVAPGGKVIYRKLGDVDPLELKKAIVGYLGRTY